jgi:hypothetical protein
MSDSKKTKTRRALRSKKMGQDRKKQLAKGTTPKFPIHPEGEKASAKPAKSAKG